MQKNLKFIGRDHKRSGLSVGINRKPGSENILNCDNWHSALECDRCRYKARHHVHEDSDEELGSIIAGLISRKVILLSGF
ncbi:hypothetical protein L1987_04347 [Smallanthus sonchifolius]|uniref:Uncharacterized protein n=1 Tax=Smallanthus sonchifolius TaxID=185202 RepID=A0ACB9KDB4_9ASTR|nr:hypothetical protein L1987_04347 [Smallanthus sonchifolius]